MVNRICCLWAPTALQKSRYVLYSGYASPRAAAPTNCRPGAVTKSSSFGLLAAVR